MNKIIAAINAMITSKNLITNVVPGSSPNEIFFVFDNKYKWSIFKSNNNNYALHYYPGSQNIENLANWSEEQWIDFREIVTYRSVDIGTEEALNSFSELYTIVQERQYDMDSVLEDIIKIDMLNI